MSYADVEQFHNEVTKAVTQVAERNRDALAVVFKELAPLISMSVDDDTLRDTLLLDVIKMCNACFEQGSRSSLIARDSIDHAMLVARSVDVPEIEIQRAIEDSANLQFGLTLNIVG